ncbi:PilZ domain-containing protein [Erythrobacter litoralis]|uniref:PilZ domain-containing protein n=1 Tax=Erythrobacter litoralis (strain HTCC2594) TaxID=314225 RepID=Q2N6Z1_ERYLH|nr:PilZ domain-containing protein [Erythrobacter litoralis]ABC64550.1 hypothetical protein ELI_12290 [Erythrobacter litoralis HTCC2594]
MSATEPSKLPSGQQSHDTRRASPRSSLMLRTAKLVCQSGEYVCIVRDVSPEGVGLRFLHAAPTERRILLELANGATYPVERVWAGKQQSGFRFAAAIDLHEFIHEPSPYRARPIRLRISAAASLASGNQAEAAGLVDLSTGGARVESARDYGIGCILRLEVGSQLSKLAEVCWADEGRLGLSFLQPMTIEELAGTALALQPYGSMRECGATDHAKAVRAA